MTKVIDKFLSHRTGEFDYTSNSLAPFSFSYENAPLKEESFFIRPNEMYELEGRIRVRYTCSPHNRDEEEKRAKSYLKRILYADVLTELGKIAILVSDGKRNETLTAIDDLVDSLSTFRETR